MTETTKGRLEKAITAWSADIDLGLTVQREDINLLIDARAEVERLQERERELVEGLKPFGILSGEDGALNTSHLTEDDYIQAWFLTAKATDPSLTKGEES